MALVTDGIYLIDEGVVGEKRASCVYLVMGERAALVDVGPTKRAMALPERLRELDIDAGKIDYILLTHIHVDHAGAAGYLCQLYPNALVVVHQAGARHLIDPSKLVEGTRAAFGPEAEVANGPVVPMQAERMVVVTGGEVIDLGAGRRLRVIDTPGHASHHLCFYDEWTRGIFTGEGMGVYHRGLDMGLPTIAPPLFDVFAAVASIRKMASFGPERFYYAHGGARENVEGAPERLVDAILNWAETTRQAMREDSDPANVVARLRLRAAEELRTLARARGVVAPLPNDVGLDFWGLMEFFNKFGLDVDLTGLREGEQGCVSSPRVSI
ncbi:MAG: MBL fold metallo-hydrolase [Chloroflexota bacterium]|nr:MAG: MBL fold metallo-hydrolase [Chloroflexota bacterium]